MGGGYTEGSGDGLGGGEVDDGEVRGGGEGRGEGYNEGGNGDAALGALEGYSLGSVGEGACGKYCVEGDADEFFGEVDAPIEGCGSHLPRLAELCSAK